MAADCLDVWVPDDLEGHPAIWISNRFFSDRRAHGPNFDNDDLPFSQQVDPNRILETAKGKNLIHLPENQVDYVEWKENK